jgi:hypothetical protein
MDGRARTRKYRADIYYSQISSIVTEKKIYPNDHGRRELILKDTQIDSSFFLEPDILIAPNPYDLFEKVELNDTLTKTRNSNVFIIHKTKGLETFYFNMDD